MPYQNQRAGKCAQSDIIKNPDVAGFLSNCNYIRDPSDDEGNHIARSFMDIPSSSVLPIKVVASDASIYANPINTNFPSTQMGYIKLSFLLVDMANFNGLTQPDTFFINPFKVAEIHRNADAFAFTLPGSNIRYKNASTVKDGFRLAVWDQLSDRRTNFTMSGPYSVIDTLFDIADGQIKIEKCPSCCHKPDSPYLFRSPKELKTCQQCEMPIYPTDSLRLHEEISDFGSNTSPMTRFMNVIEHLSMASLIRMLSEHQPETLSRMAFIIDGPLAIFGEPSWVSKRLMYFYNRINRELDTRGLPAPLIIGLQKEGQAMDHARSIQSFVGAGRYRVIDDDYRKQYISAGMSNSLNFGDETYYGQDFILKTEKGQIFVIALPYPFSTKNNKAEFSIKKTDVSRYPALGRSFDLIKHFELDLYQSAIIPIALAHRHASISLVPGGKVLDLMTKHGLSMK